MDLLNELWKINELLTKALEQYKARGREYAKAYRDYRVLLAQELLKLKADGMPVTIAYDIARGTEEVAKAKEQETISESLYNSCQEAINTYKLQIKILQEQINKGVCKWRLVMKKNISVGDIIGDYVILEELERKNSQHRYKVMCNNCKEISTKYKHHLIRNTKCPHLRFDKKYGKLQIVEKTQKRYKGNVIYKCVCDCGKVCYKNTDELTQKYSLKSCGCDRQSNLENNTERLKESIKKYYKENTFLCSLTSRTSEHTTPVKGVYIEARTQKYCAHIHLKGKKYFLGRFNTLEAATKARKLAEDILFEPIIEKYKNELKGKH